jgi:HK97 family phage portal protein
MMGVWEWLKTQFSRDKYTQSSLKLVEGAGSIGQKPQPFNYRNASNAFASWVYAAASLNAHAAAAVPLRLYVRKKGTSGLKCRFSTRRPTRRVRRYLAGEVAGAKPSRIALSKAAEFADDYEEVTEPHPAIKLLQWANPISVGYELATIRHIYMELTGNAYLHPVIDARLGVPVELWTMPSQWTYVIPAKRDSGELVEAYGYGQTPIEMKRFELDEVIHFKRPNPTSQFYGLGKVESAWGAVTANDALHTMDTALYSNHARPDYAVIIKSGASDTAIKQFEEQVNAKLKGTRNTGKFLTIGGDVQIIPMQWPPKDLAGRDNIVEEIASVFGVPLARLRGNDPVKANSEEGNVAWQRDTILPMLTYDEERLNSDYLPLWNINEDSFLAYDNPVPEDAVYDRETRVAYVNSGIIARNEAREELGMEPVDGGDELLVPTTVQPIKKAGEDKPDPMAMAAGLGKFPPKKPKEPKEPAKARVDVCVHVKQDASNTTREGESETRLEHLQRAVKAALSARMRECVRAFHSYDWTQKKDVLGDLDKFMEELRKSSDDWGDKLADEIEPTLRSIIIEGGKFGLDQVDADIGMFGVHNPAVRDFIQGYVPKLAGAIDATTMDAIHTTLTNAIGEGASIVDMAQQLRECSAFSAYRCETIARTESARAYASGQERGWMESGVVEGKRWLAAPDCCEFCAEVGEQFGENTVRLGEAFFKRGHTLEAGGKTMSLDYSDIESEPLHPNCRCGTVPVMMSDEEGD